MTDNEDGGRDRDRKETTQASEADKRPQQAAETERAIAGTDRTREKDPEISGNGLASGLQSGGIKPGGGPGAMVGSIGTGGGSDDNEPTGDAGRNNIDEEQR